MAKTRFLRINRLRILQRGHVIYDQQFHDGVNIIRGQNGSGKSTIADFIFFILGGDFDGWKEAAARCDQIQAEIETPKGKLTLHRSIETKLTPVNVYFGDLEEANNHALEGWSSYPIRRSERKESFSQIIFRSLNIPEAQSEGASNITMHQLLRLCYSDQRTPATRLFRYEPFDSQNIREAVGNLICGISEYEIYEINLRIRELDKHLDEINTRLFGLLKALPPDEALQSSITINEKIVSLAAEKMQLINEIEEVDKHITAGEVKEFLQERENSQKKLANVRKKMQKMEFVIRDIEYELREIAEYIKYISELTSKLTFSEATLDAVGYIKFVYCPACGTELNHTVGSAQCGVCKNPTNPEKEKSQYNRIRADLEIQARESKQLLINKEADLFSSNQELKSLKSDHEKLLSIYDMKYSGSNGPREAYLAEKTSRIGHINAEIEFLTRSLGIAGEIDLLHEKRGEFQFERDKLKLRNDALQGQASKRRERALNSVSEIGVSILRSDFKRQEEFENAQKMEITFINDAISVDGQVNFAESSNVFLKNTAILSMFLAAGKDDAFFHPRFLLLDNIEDKGMEMERSHLFQRLIVERVTELENPFQVIFTTSMMNPQLELDDYVIGPAYTKEHKTLELTSYTNTPQLIDTQT